MTRSNKPSPALQPFLWLGAALLVFGLGISATAAELTPALRNLIEHFAAHRRIALGYLQAHDSDLGAIALERLQRDLATDRTRIRPDDPALTLALEKAAATIAASLKAVDAGANDEATVLIASAASSLDDWRHKHGIRLFSDCIAEVNVAYRNLEPYRATAPSLDSAAAREAITAAASAMGAAAARCDQEAPAAIHNEPEFRRLIDGLKASLNQLPDAMRERDADKMHRLIDEERAFDRLLAFRFG